MACRRFQIGDFHGHIRLDINHRNIIHPNYAAPEQIGKRGKDERTDIWQLGVIFYELVTGQLPFTGDSMVEVMSSIATKNPTMPTAINPFSHDVEAMIMKVSGKESR